MRSCVAEAILLLQQQASSCGTTEVALEGALEACLKAGRLDIAWILWILTKNLCFFIEFHAF